MIPSFILVEWLAPGWMTHTLEASDDLNWMDSSVLKGRYNYSKDLTTHREGEICWVCSIMASFLDHPEMHHMNHVVRWMVKDLENWVDIQPDSWMVRTYDCNISRRRGFPRQAHTP